MTIDSVLKEAVEILKNNQIENPILHARILLGYLLNQDKTYLITNNQKELDTNEEKKFFLLVDRLAKGEPIQYITNHQEFMKLDFYVDENVLIPRADTEISVEKAIEIINEKQLKESKEITVLDMCTGSGAIAVSIAKYTERTKIQAADISKDALNIASKNAANNEVSDKCKFIESNMFENIEDKFDVIISNPPYIKQEVIKKLENKAQKAPITALDGGIDGLDFYRILVNESYKYLNNDGYLIMEIGYDQKEEVVELLEKSNNYDKIECIKDLAGNDRVVIATKR